jgi:hypothetical protein
VVAKVEPVETNILIFVGAHYSEKVLIEKLKQKTFPLVQWDRGN